MSDSVYQGIGALTFPVTEDDVDDTLTPLDPARAVMTALFKAAINSELTAVWTKVTGSTHQLAGTLPVQDTLELEPSKQVMQQRKCAFPLLCVHRTGTATLDQHTIAEDKLTQTWNVHYILGPLDVSDARKVLDVCIAVVKLIRIVVRQRGHKSYESGALQFGSDAPESHLATIEVKSFEGPGQVKFAEDDPIYYAVSLSIETTEITSDDLEAFGPFQAVDISIGVGTGAEILPEVIQADSTIPLQVG